MTTNHGIQTAAPPRRRITMAAKVILAAGAIALGAMSLTPAMANAEKRGPKGDAYHDCAMEAFHLFMNGTLPWDLYLFKQEECCLNLGGTYNEETDECYLDGEPTGRGPDAAAGRGGDPSPRCGTDPARYHPATAQGDPASWLEHTRRYLVTGQSLMSVVVVTVAVVE